MLGNVSESYANNPRLLPVLLDLDQWRGTDLTICQLLELLIGADKVL